MAKAKEFSYGRTLHSGVLSEEGRKNFDKIDWKDTEKKYEQIDNFKGMAIQA